MPETILTRVIWTVPISVAALIIGLCLGAWGGVYYQQQTDRAVIAEKDSLLMQMQQALAQQSAPDAPTPVAGATQAVLRPIAITFSSLPREGDRVCRDTPLTLSWVGDPSQVDEVVVTVNAPFPASPIADVPLMYNERGIPGQGTATWTVGSAMIGQSAMNIPDGDLYHLTVTALYKGAQVYTQDSGTFAIDTCKG